MTITDSVNSKRKTNSLVTTPVKQPKSEQTYDENEGYIQIEKAVAHKVNALKNIHLNIVGLEEKFYEELHQLECKYAKLYEAHFEQREQIVTGKREPTAEEAVWKLDANEGEEKDDVKALATQMEAQIDLKERGEFVGKQSQRMIYGYMPRSFSGIFSFFGVVVLSFGINEDNARSLN